MFQTLKHTYNLFKHYFRDLHVNGAKRSPYWPAVERNFRRNHPSCAACGSLKRINVHHCKPFHLYPELELEMSNLISLCMGPNECHFHLGHGGDFKAYCPNVRQYAQIALEDPTPETFEHLKIEAHRDRIYSQL